MRAGLVFCLAGLLMAPPADPATKPKPKAASSTTMTGCVDQRNNTFVLTGDKELKTHAVLHGDGFSDDNFARHLGHTVTVEGTLASQGGTKVMKVRKVTPVSDFCSPQ